MSESEDETFPLSIRVHQFLNNRTIEVLRSADGRKTKTVTGKLWPIPATTVNQNVVSCTSASGLCRDEKIISADV